MLESEGEPESTLETCRDLILLCRSAPAGGQADFSAGSSKQSLVSGSARMLELSVRMCKQSLTLKIEGRAFGNELSLKSWDVDMIHSWISSISSDSRGGRAGPVPGRGLRK